MSLVLIAFSGAAAPVHAVAPRVPDHEDAELLVAAELSPIGDDADIIRYTLRRGFYGSRSEPKALVVQVSWAYNAEEPRALLVELAHRDGAWRVTEQRQAPMDASAFRQLVNDVAAAASVIGNRPGPRGVLACSHVDTSRLDLSILDDRELRMSRGAHCFSDAPAVVAGKLLTDAVRKALQLDTPPANTPD